MLPSTSAKGPLDGIRVVELATVLMAPFGTQILGDMGADVIKVESDVLDSGRMLGGGPHEELSGIALNLHRNKRSVRLDLKQSMGREAFLRLLGTAEVFVTNLRPAALKRLAIDYDSIGDDLPGLVYCEAHGFPAGTPDEERPAFDDIIQAETGLPRLAELTGGQASFWPAVMADKLSGLYVAQAVLGALVHHRATGRGQRVEMSMFEAVLSFNLVEHLGAAAIAGQPAGYRRILTAHRGPHKTADGYIAMIPYSDRDWRAIFSAVGCAHELDEEPFASKRSRHANPDRVYGRLAEVIAMRTTDEWTELCLREGVPVGQVPALAEIIEDASLHRGVLEPAVHPEIGQYRQIRPPVSYAETPMQIRRAAPLVGQHTIEILREIGIGPREIDRMLETAAAYQPPESSLQRACDDG